MLNKEKINNLEIVKEWPFINKFVEVVTEAYPNIDLTKFYEGLPITNIIVDDARSIWVNFSKDAIDIHASEEVYGNVDRNNMGMIAEQWMAHEFFHYLFGYDKVNHRLIAGFEEGCAEYLSQKLFGDLNDQENLHYNFSVLIVQGIEEVVGPEKFICYINRFAPLELMDELSNYVPEEDVKKLFHYMSVVDCNHPLDINEPLNQKVKLTNEDHVYGEQKLSDAKLEEIKNHGFLIMSRIKENKFKQNHTE